MIDGDAVGRSDGILSAIALADGVFLVVLAVEVEAQVVDDFTSLFGQSVFLHQRQHGQFHGRERSRQFQNGARFAVFELFLVVGVAHDREEHPIDAYRGLDDVGHVALVSLRVEILDLLAREFLVLREVEIRARVDAFHLLETEGHLELDVGGGVGVVRQLVVVVEAIVFSPESQCLMPRHAPLLPCFEPVELRAGLHEELHLHLLEFAHAENELPRHDFVAERLSDLRDAERQLHATCFLHVQVVHEDALRRFGSQIHLHRAVGRGTHFGGKHEVELAHVGPVPRAADGAHDFLVENDLLQLGQVGTLHGGGKALVQCVALLLDFGHARRCCEVLLFVERIAESLAGFFHFLLDFLVVFRHLILNEHVGAIAFFRVAVVNQRVVERIDMARGLPNRRMHENGRVETHDVLVEQDHRLPPILLDIVFQLHAVLTVVIDRAESVVNVA